MRPLKKYFAILIIMVVIPISWAVGKNFITDASTEIYGYIPQEADIVVEINNRNFISEIMYQRIYNEDYVNNTVEVEEEDIPTGIDYFSKVILFREQWAEESVWIGIVAVNNDSEFRNFVEEKIDDSHIVFGDDHAIIQLTASSDQAAMDEHLKNIANKKTKPFTARVDLRTKFDKDKEINCFLIPQSRSHVNNQIAEGVLSMDFHYDHIDIDGDFTTVHDFVGTPFTKYPLNEDVALSLRSSLNVFNSIWWFSKEQIEDVPEYDQIAIDYDGVALRICDKNWGYPFPFKSFPEMQMQFDYSQPEQWKQFMAEVINEEKVRIDTITNSLITEQGAFFKYDLTDNAFQLSRAGTNFKADESENLYFDFQMKFEQLISNTVVEIDEENPPTAMESALISMAMEGEIEGLHTFDNIEQVRFKMMEDGEEKIKAEGHVQMKNRDGQSIVEGMYFITEALFYIKAFLTPAPTSDPDPVVITEEAPSDTISDTAIQ